MSTRRTFLKGILGALLAPSAVLVTPAAAMVTPMSKLSALAADFDGDTVMLSRQRKKFLNNSIHGAYAPTNVQFYKR